MDDATERRCSQCHAPLPADSASEWWCDPPVSPYVVSCQEAWYQERATDPDDVLDRKDAAEVLMGRDAMRVPLNEPPTEAMLLQMAEQMLRNGNVYTYLPHGHHTPRITVLADDGGEHDLTDYVSGVEVGPVIIDEMHWIPSGRWDSAIADNVEPIRSGGITAAEAEAQLRESIRRLTNSGGTT